ncbi:nose resistant to fluoxetine protein 6 [Galendromus occidentalis]|uniref:Nose resistant to fluoxetine protein 6 n=1 Tax=Galendromus occidentalis TaxID=34638 RepID=A0AAJ7SIG6_9ACAR|nr:nose resistant to fluoxetine protein 6 [Galendromus occidentalis]
MPRPVLVLLCVLLLSGTAHSGEDEHTQRLHDHALEDSGSPSTTTEEAEEEWREETTTMPPDGIIDIEPFIEQLAEDGFRRGLPIFSRFNGDDNVTVDCSAALIKFMFAMRKLTPWALRMVDSMGKPPSGLASGTVADLGNYDQCLEVVAPNGDDEVDFTGQYCTFYMNPKKVKFLKKVIDRFQENGEYINRADPLQWLNQDLFLGVRMGICIPSTCSGGEIQYMAKALLEKYGVIPTVAGCELPRTGKEPLTRTQKFMFGLISSFTTIITIASLWEYYYIYYKKQPSRSLKPLYTVVHCFSAVENTRKLLSTKVALDSDAYRLRFIHGMRFFSASWVILGHTYFLIIPTALANSLNIIKLQEDIWFCLIGNAFPCIQTFLFMSGFLLSFNVLKYLSSYKKSLAMPIFLLLARRYIRLTTPIMFLVGLFLVLPRFISGPVYSEYKDIVFGTCEINWWRVLLHVNNWIPFFDMCLAHLWYVSVDWQIYSTLWVIPIIMLRRKRLGLGLCALVIFGTAVMVGIQTKVNSYQPTPIYSDPNVNRTFDASNEVYFKPFAHAGSFCIGIITGYMVLAYGTYKLAVCTQGLLWILSGTIGLLVVFGPYKWFAGAPHEGWDAVIYAATHRTAWSIGLGWLSFACATGRGGLINGLLAWKALIPMSRLSFSAFMLQTVVLLTRTMTARDRLIFSHDYLLRDFFATYMVTYLASFVMYLLIEAPIGNLEKMIFMRATPKKPLDPPPIQTNGQVEHVVTMESIQKKQSQSNGELRTVRL